MEVVVVGAGPAGVIAALRAADLGARTTLVSSGPFGGMAATDGPVPVRTLAHAARLARNVLQFEDYGIAAGAGGVDYPTLLARVSGVVETVGRSSALRDQIDALGVVVHEHAGAARFVDAHTIETGNGLSLTADRFILCTGGASRRLPLPGFELTCTHSDAWALRAVPASLLVVGSGATGCQVASVFDAFGARVQLFEAGPRILSTEDEDVSEAIATAFRRSGMDVREGFGTIESFEKTATGVQMNFSKDGVSGSAEAEVVVTALGWVADTAALNLAAAGVELTERGFIRVDGSMATSAPHIFAAGDVIGGLMLAPQAMQEGFLAATSALGEAPAPEGETGVNPIGSFTDPEYAQVGLTETKARATHEVIVARVEFAAITRPLIDGREEGFCKLIVDMADGRILGCHVVGERAVDIVQIAAVAMAAGMTIDELARVPLSYPTYAGVLGRAAVSALHQLQRGLVWRAAAASGPVHLS